MLLRSDFLQVFEDPVLVCKYMYLTRARRKALCDFKNIDIDVETH